MAVKKRKLKKKKGSKAICKDLVKALYKEVGTDHRVIVMRRGKKICDA
jgi:hypothetical protein